jgi:hypothetical protein
MSSQIFQPTRALEVAIPVKGYVEIPFPDVMWEGPMSPVIGRNDQIQVDTDVIALGVSSGDVLYIFNSDTGVTYGVMVDYVVAPNIIGLLLASNPTTNGTVKIYKGGQNRGCILYVPSENPYLNVRTAAGEDFTISITGKQYFFPVQVVGISSDNFNASNIVAFW